MAGKHARAIAIAACALALAAPDAVVAQSRDSTVEARVRATARSRDSVLETRIRAEARIQDARMQADRTRQSEVIARQLEVARATAELQALEQEFRTLRVRLDSLVTRMATEPASRASLTDSLVNLARRSLVVNSRAEAMRRGLQQERQRQVLTEARKGWLGVNFEGGLVEETPAGAVLWAPDYPRVFTVAPGSPAEMAGLTRGDRIMTIAGRDVRTNAIMLDQVFRPGRTVVMRVERQGRPQIVNVRVTERPQWVAVRGPGQTVPAASLPPTVFPSATPLPYGAVFKVDSLMPSNAVGTFSGQLWASTVTAPEVRVRAMSPAESRSITTSVMEAWPAQAVEVETLTGAPVALRSSDLAYAFGARLTTLSVMLAQEFKASDGGVLVLDVAPGTPASRAGLRPLDVLVRANGQQLQNPQALIRLLRNTEGKVLQLQIVRKGEKSEARLSW